MDAVQSVNAGASMSQAPAMGGAIAGSAATGASGAAASTSATSMSSMSMTLESRVDMFMTQQNSTADDQFIRALVLLLIFMQMTDDEDSDEKKQDMLAALGALYAQSGKTEMSAASFQAVSMSQSMSMGMASGTTMSAQAVSGSAGATGGSINVLA